MDRSFNIVQKRKQFRRNDDPVINDCRLKKKKKGKKKELFQ